MARKEYSAEDWPAQGLLNLRGFCVVCKSHWCPHAAPGLYQPRPAPIRRTR